MARKHSFLIGHKNAFLLESEEQQAPVRHTSNRRAEGMEEQAKEQNRS